MVELSSIGISSLAMGASFIFSLFIMWYSWQKSQQRLSEIERDAQHLKEKIEGERREAQLKIKDERHKRRYEFEQEEKKKRIELDRRENKLNTRIETLESKELNLDSLKRELQQKERNLSHIEDRLQVSETKIKHLYDDLTLKLERVSNMTRDEAKKALLSTLKAEVDLTSQKWIQKVEDDARNSAKEQATQIVVTAMQRYTADQVTAHSSSVVQLPNDEMKGRIIGKEGRNIKALEMATGMEFVIGDTPEIITISGFNPVRKEIARRSLEKLVADGRINPTRIEETVEHVEKEVEDIIQEFGKEVVLEFNLQGVAQEIVTLLGKLHFRTSFSQNVLVHCKEVGIFSRMIAEELGLDGDIALRAGLLHDIGKSVTAEIEGPHAIIGADIARRCGENPLIINAIAAHHEEVAFTSIYSPIVVVADIISASRPGARRETLTTYIKRLEKLEEIAHSFEGVKKAYALQAGREIRIIVQEDRLTDEEAINLARDIARKVESEMNFPGQIKINVIREKRAIEYAR